MTYAKINTQTLEVSEFVACVPDEVLGLAQETLNDLTEISSSIPEFNNIGFWQVETVHGADTDEVTVDAERKVVVQHTVEPETPRVAIHVATPSFGRATELPDTGAPRAETSITCIGNVFTKMMRFAHTGDVMPGHRHAYDHPTLLAKGSLEVDYQGIKTTFVAPTAIFIKADTLHQLTALEDDTLAFCIHPLRDKDSPGDLLEPSNIPDGVNPVSLAAPLLSPPPQE